MAVMISGIKPTVTCPATLYLPADGGTFVAHQFEVVFKRLPSDVRDKLHERYTVGYLVDVPATPSTATEPGAAPTQVRKFLTHAELLDEIVDGWGGMLDENGAPVPYSHAERRATDRVFGGLEQAMAVSWYEHFFVHQREAAQKNSGAQSGTTSAGTTRAAT